VANLVAMRCIIRCPLLAAITKAVPARPKGRKTGVPDMFWLFYLQATRQLVTQEQLDQDATCRLAGDQRRVLVRALHPAARRQNQR